MSPAITGLFVGLILGLALVLTSFGDMLIVAIFGAIGFAVAKVIDGDLDLNELLSRARTQR